jgi:transcriptional regulator with XRE-family HTH domain
MPKPRYSDPYPFSETIGPRIREARTEQQLSEHQLAKRTGVSRRHLSELQKGSNATLQVTFKAMGALGLTELTHTAHGQTFALKLRHTPATIQPADLMEAAETVEQAAAALMEYAARLRAALPAGAPPRPNPTREQQVAGLLDDFSKVFKDLDPKAQVDLLRQLAHASALPSSEPPIASAPQGKKRKSRPV